MFCIKDWEDLEEAWYFIKSAAKVKIKKELKRNLTLNRKLIMLSSLFSKGVNQLKYLKIKFIFFFFNKKGPHMHVIASIATALKEA